MSSMVESPMPFGWRQHNALGFGFAGSSPSSSRPAAAAATPSKRRKRSATPEGHLDDVEMSQQQQQQQLQPQKRIKSESVRRFKSPLRPKSPVSADDVDLGKMLSSLSKPALIHILTSLAAQQPQLKPAIASLVPPPSLEAYTDLLAAMEKKLVDALPLGANLRQEYIWGRIRTPLEEYVQENRHHLAVFTSPSPDASTSTFAEIHHPSTVFAFLVTLTQSVERLEAVLPRAPPSATTTTESAFSGVEAAQYRLNPNDPLTSSLIPLLINAWHVLVTKAAVAVNQEGRIWSADMLRTRLRTLDDLCAPAGDTLTRKAMEGVRDRLLKEIGWLIAGSSAGWQAFEQQHRARRARSMSMEDDL